MNFDKEQYDKEMEKDFNIWEKQNFNEGLNKENMQNATRLCEHFNGKVFDRDTGKYNAILDNIDNYLPDNSNIDATSKLDFQYRNTDVFPLKIQDKAYSREYFLDCGVPEENLPKEYGVYESYEDFEKDINTFKDKDIVIKYSLGADCNQVIRIKKGEIVKKTDEIKKLFNENGGTDYVTGGNLKGAAKKLFVVQENIAPDNENFPDDFKFWCINGKPAFCEVMTGRKSELKCAFIDLTGRRMPLWHKLKENMSNDELKEILSKLTKEQFEKMKELCEKVSKDIPLIRTDFCLGKDRKPKVIEAQDLYMMHLNVITFNEKSISGNSWHFDSTTKNGKECMAVIPDSEEVIDNDYKNNMEQVARTLGLQTGKYLTNPIYNSKTKKFGREVSPFNKMIGNLIDLTLIKSERIDNTDGKKATDEAKRYIENLKEQQNALSKISKIACRKKAFNESASKISKIASKSTHEEMFFSKLQNKNKSNQQITQEEYEKYRNMPNRIHEKIKEDIAKAINQHLGKPKDKQKKLYWNKQGDGCKNGKLLNERCFLKGKSGYIKKINRKWDELLANNQINYTTKLHDLKSFVDQLNEKEANGCCPF